jgi:hypothetical protein
MLPEVLMLVYLGLFNRNESSEGAFGFTPESSSPASEEAASSTLTREQEEIRRRRIQKFGQAHSSD